MPVFVYEAIEEGVTRVSTTTSRGVAIEAVGPDFVIPLRPDTVQEIFGPIFRLKFEGDLPGNQLGEFVLGVSRLG